MKLFKAPDIHAPRFRKKTLNLLNLSTIDEFKAEHPEYEDLDVEIYKKIVKTFNEKIWRTVIDKRDGVSLPENLGFLFIGTCDRPKKKNINYGLSQKLGKNTTHQNLESDSKLAKIFYTNYSAKYKFTNRDLWMFSAVRQFKRELAKEYSNNWMRYINIKSNEKVSHIFSSRLREHKPLREYQDILDAYDEFKFD
jgi:hypothetical protein